MLGYEEDEVLDKKSIDFLTDESRARAIKDTLPLFWKSGSARSVGYRFVRKNGQAIDLLLDAEAFQDSAGQKCTYAALYDGQDHIQWELASSTIRVLKALANLQQQLTNIPSEEKNEATDPNIPRTSDSSQPSLEIDAIGEAQGQILESARIAGASLQALARVHDELVAGAAEQQRELRLVAQGFDKILAEIAARPPTSP